MAAGQENVLRLDVAVHDSLRVGIAERIGHLECHADGVVNRKLPFAIELVAEGLSLHEWHHIVKEGIGRAGIEQAENVRMLQLGGEADLALEALAADRCAQLRVQHLDGDFALVLDILGQEHGRHPAAPEFAFDGVPVGQRLPEPRQRIRIGGLRPRPARRPSPVAPA